ncbi:hypothetical protein D9M68_966800 [compost metagenome]
MIVPVVIRGIHRVLPARTLQLNLGQPVELHVGQPVDAAAFAGQDVDALIGEVRGRMQALLGGHTAPDALGVAGRQEQFLTAE